MAVVRGGLEGFKGKVWGKGPPLGGDRAFWENRVGWEPHVGSRMFAHNFVSSSTAIKWWLSASSKSSQRAKILMATSGSGYMSQPGSANNTISLAKGFATPNYEKFYFSWPSALQKYHYSGYTGKKHSDLFIKNNFSHRLLTTFTALIPFWKDDRGINKVCENAIKKTNGPHSPLNDETALNRLLISKKTSMKHECVVNKDDRHVSIKTSLVYWVDDRGAQLTRKKNASLHRIKNHIVLNCPV